MANRTILFHSANLQDVLGDTVPVVAVDNGNGTWSLSTASAGGASPVSGSVVISNGSITIVPTASELHLGEVGGRATPVTVTFQRPSGSGAYSAKDTIGTALVISDSSNASPIVITTTTHTLADGDPITISGITGNTNANGDRFALVSGYSGSTFALYSDSVCTVPVAGNGEHGGSGLVAKLFRLPNIFRVNGGTGYITKIRIITDSVTFLDQLKIHFYSTPITALLDHAQFTLLWANRTARLGMSTLPALATEGTGSDSSSAVGTPGDSQSNLPLFVHNGDNTRDLYFRLETLGTGTPTTGQKFMIELTLDAN
jgi:hypothetical protein